MTRTALRTLCVVVVAAGLRDVAYLDRPDPDEMSANDVVRLLHGKRAWLLSRPYVITVLNCHGAIPIDCSSRYSTQSQP